MAVTDPIADLLTRIRNGNQMLKKEVTVPHSKMKEKIVEIMRREGYIKDFKVENAHREGKKKNLRVFLKYSKEKERVLKGLRRISKPGLRIYTKKDEIPRVLGGLGIAILSTSKGLLTDKESRAANVGGEVICYIW